MDLFAFGQRHLRAILTLALALLGAGVFAAFQLPVGLFPNVSFPRVVVSAESPSLPAEQMMVQVTRPLEEALATVPGIRRYRSATTRGACDISANLDWGRDMAQATLQIQASVNQVQASLPRGTLLTVRRMDPTVFPVVAYSLTSERANQNQVALRDLGAYTLRPLLLRVPGVAKVSVQGGKTREFEIVCDAAKLRARGLAPQAVMDALAKSNQTSEAGLLQSPYRLYLAIADGRAASNAAIAAIAVVTGVSGQTVTVGDVATVSEGSPPRYTRVMADGHEAVLVNIFQQPGGNTLAIDAGVRQTLAEHASLLPAGVKMSQFYDQGELIADAMGSVRDAILVGIALGIGVIFWFLRRWRLTLLAAVSVPATLGITILLLQAFHLSFNVMTLGGLAAAVGLVLDDAIVMLENIARHLAMGDAPEEATGRAVRELTVPFIGSSLSSIVVFAPLAFLTGVTGAFFRSLSLTMAAALAISLVLTLVALPSLAARFLTPADVEAATHHSERPDRLAGGYRRLMGWLLPRPWIAGVGCLALLVGVVGLYQTLPNGFLPAMDEGAFVLDYKTPPGTSLAETDALLARIERELAKVVEVASYSRRTGVQLGEGLTEPNQGDFLVKLKRDRSRNGDAITEGLRAAIEPQLPGVHLEFAQIMEDLIGDLTAVPQPIEVKVIGPDFAVDRTVAKQIAALIPAVPGVVDVSNGVVVAGPALRAVVDPAAAGRLGVGTAEVSSAMQFALEGQIAGSVLVNNQVRDLRVRVGDPLAMTRASLGELPVALPAGGTIPLASVARIALDPGTTEISRENLQAMVAVTARIEGQSLGGTVERIKALVTRDVKLPPGVTLEYGGLYEEQQASFHGLLVVIAAALVLVVLVLLFEFGSFAVPLSILAVDVSSLFGVLAALAVTHTPLNISSMMGAVMIVGIVAENAVFFIHYVQQFRDDGLTLDAALVEAGAVRMRPVAMTSLAAILALMPLALGVGAGAQLQRPLAIAVIGGFVVSAALILLVLPVFFRVLERRGSRKPSAPPPARPAA